MSSERRPLFDQWVVYDHPLDFPLCFVARCFKHDPDANTYQPTDELVISPDVNSLRLILQRRGLVPLMRTEDDDPVILEVWL